MSYSFMTIEKINRRNSGALTSKYNHNCRKVDVKNADSDLSYLNDELIALERNADGTEKGYLQAVSDRINELDYYKTRKIRTNATAALEIVMTYSKDENVDAEEWKQRSVEWLKDTFNISPDQKNNVIHAICHEDEAGNRHIHAIVVPIDNEGHLNAKYYLDGSRAMQDLQTSYADAVYDLGLERGIPHSTAKHKDIRKWYADINNAKDSVPVAFENETANDYRDRVIQDLETAYMFNAKKLDEHDRMLREKQDKERNLERIALQEEYDRTMYLANANIANLEDTKMQLESEIRRLKADIKRLQMNKEELEEHINRLKDEQDRTENREAL